MLLSDRQIAALAADGMIYPFERDHVRKTNMPVLSYGCSSYGYDLRLSDREFYVFRHIPGTVVDPKNFNYDNLEPVSLHSGEHGDYFILPGLSYGLGAALERLVMPPNVTAICVGKSTYARTGIIVNVTPAEAGWRGHLTLEFSNSSQADCKVYVKEGVCQLLFLQGSNCDVTYDERSGKYQDQGEEVVMAKV